MKMHWWSWILVAVAVVLVGLFAVQAPEIVRYAKIRRM